MATDFSLEYNPDDIIAKNYKVVKELYSDDVGVTYLCTYCEYEDRFTAVKLLYPFIADDKRARVRVQQAITASYQVTHQNVIRTYEYIKEQNVIGYSMEYVDGYFLADMLRVRGKLPPLECAKLLQQICAGTYAIHSANIIHRSLKPGNMIIRSDDCLKICNFVFARDRDAGAITEPGGIVGTLAYMSPEYLQTGEFDFRSDLYAIGIIGYEMLTGSTPTKAGNTIEFIQNRTSRPIPDIIGQGINCPQQLEDIIMKALRIEAKERFQTALEMERSLENFIKTSDNNNFERDTAPSLTTDIDINNRPTLTDIKEVQTPESEADFSSRPTDTFSADTRDTLCGIPDFTDLKDEEVSDSASFISKIILFFKEFRLSKGEIVIILFTMLITLIIRKCF